MKSSQIAAAVLAAVAVNTAQAEEGLILGTSYEKVMCIPVWSYNGTVEVASMCDASGINKKYNLKVDQNGCALEGQQLEEQNGDVYQQARAIVWGETQEELNKKLLPECSEFEAAAFVVEL
jgi:hypothetical protein